MSYSDSVIQAESGGNPNAANPNSSAQGAGQFIDSTWLSTVKQHRPDLAQGKTDAEILAHEVGPALSGQMVDAYGNDNAAILSKAGLPVTDGSKYLAHFAGPQGAVKILQADPNAPATDILGTSRSEGKPVPRWHDGSRSAGMGCQEGRRHPAGRRPSSPRHATAGSTASGSAASSDPATTAPADLCAASGRRRRSAGSSLCRSRCRQPRRSSPHSSGPTSISLAFRPLSRASARRSSRGRHDAL
jgi:hypothetical protein